MRAAHDQLPSGWRTKKLKHVASLRSGEGITSDSIEEQGSYPVYGGNGLRGYTTSFTHDGEFVLIGRQGALCGNVHHVSGQFWASEHAVVATFYAGDNPKWARHVFDHMNLGEYSVAAAQPGLAVDRIKELSIPVPPADQQLAIAAYLDAETARIDALIEAKRSLKATLEEFARSIFFAEIVELANTLPGRHDERLAWLQSTPTAWTRCKIKHLVDRFDQGISPQCESRTPDENEWGVLKVGCINSGDFDPSESKALPPDIASVPEVTVCAGDLIISRANTKELVGRCAVAQRDYPRLMLSDKLYRIKLNSSLCIPEFVRRTLWVPSVRTQIEGRATGASPSMLNIDRRTILEIDLVLPPLTEQTTLLQRVDERTGAIRQLIAHVDKEIGLLVSLRSSTITDAVLGRTDVRAHMKH